MSTLLQRFLRYVAFDTQSDPDCLSRPSTPGQSALLQLLAGELRALGIKAEIDANSNLMAFIPANNGKTCPSVAFLAHVDTATEVSGKNVQAQVIGPYDGGDIPLTATDNKVLRPADFPALSRYKGQTIITSGGNTLLGADDKAGVAIIMQLAQHLSEHPELPHGELRIAFTPDEETGRGTDNFDMQAFGADYAYTFDGGGIGELEYENFNAAQATLTVQGCNMHPGEAGTTFRNALLLLEAFNRQLPAGQRPETTSGYQGFFLLSQVQGNSEKAVAKYLIRDHSSELFAQKKAFLESLVDTLNREYGAGSFNLKITDQYYNMRPLIEQQMEVVEIALEAMRMAGVKPDVKPIRGGTDGARLTYMGLPCPNLFAGGHNFHSIYEFVPLQSMEKALEVALNIVRLYENHQPPPKPPQLGRDPAGNPLCTY